MNDFTHLKEREFDNHEWAKDVRARVDDLNELLEEAASRDVIVAGSIAMNTAYYSDGSNNFKRIGTIVINLSQRI